MINMERRKIPEIRFKGFSEDWEEEQLSNIYEFSNGINAPKESYGKGRKMVSVLDILRDRNIIYDEIVSSVQLPKEQEETKKLEKGDMVFVRSSEVVEEVGWAKSYNEDKYALFSGFSIRGKKKSNNLSYFIELSLNNKNRKQIENKAGGSTRYNVSQKILREINLLLPELTEQEKIGQLFESIDKMIEAQRKLIEENKKLKKSLLQKMFPKKGEKLPELRLKGFSGDWEEKRLREIGEIKTGKTPPTSNLAYYNKKGVMFITPTDINSRITTDTKRRLSLEGIKKSTIAKSGSILITCIASIGKNTLILEDSTFNQQINSITPYHEESSYFILVQSIVMSNYMKNIASSGIMQIINKTEFSNIKILVPSLKEQEAIGKLFKSLDEKIENEEKKLENYKNLKKSLLQKMFI